MKKMLFATAKLACAVLVGSIAVSPLAQALSVKADPLAAKGCISRLSKDEALSAMRRFHIMSFNGTTMEIRTLGTALYYIEKLNGGKPLEKATAEADDKYEFHFNEATRNSRQESGRILVNRNGSKRYGENMAQLVHEIGHYIGNNGAYGDYYSAMGGHYCIVSSYSDNNSHEQFAEVFAAFVTRPALLKRSESPNCRKAFKFFSTVLFPSTSAAIQMKCMERQDAGKIGAPGEATPKPTTVTAKPKPQNSTPVKPAATSGANKPSTATGEKPASATNKDAVTNKPATTTNKPASSAAPTEKPAAATTTNSVKPGVSNSDEGTKPAAKSADKPADKPADQPANKPAETPAAKPAAQPPVEHDEISSHTQTHA